MRFLHPHILYFLMLLLIPVVVHLFRLYRFKKIPFPNVSFLREIDKESRKTRNLRKWIILLTRLALMSFLILGFAGPYTGKAGHKTTNTSTVFFDPSYSLSYREGEISLRNTLTTVAEKLLTRQKIHVFSSGQFKEIQGEKWLAGWKRRGYAPQVTPHNRIIKQLAENPHARTVFYFTDGQFLSREDLMPARKDSLTRYYFILRSPATFSNVEVDTVYIEKRDEDNISFSAVIRSIRHPQKIDVSLYTGNNLFSKSFIHPEGKTSDTFRFQIARNLRVPYASIKLQGENRLLFDNTLYFVLPSGKAHKILIAGENPPAFLKTLFSAGNHEVHLVKPGEIPWENIDSFDLVILYGWEPFYNIVLIKNIPSVHFVFIPSGEQRKDLLFYENIGLQNIEKDTARKELTYVDRNHPFFRDAFKKIPVRFQAPRFQWSYRFASRYTKLLGLNDQTPLFSRFHNIYFFSAGIAPENSDFYLSPFVVPVFYRALSFHNKPLYYILGKTRRIVLKTPGNHEIPVRLVKGQKEWIPYQETSGNKTVLYPGEALTEPGIYFALRGTDTLSVLAFNIDRRESRPVYFKPEKEEISGNIRFLNSQADVDTFIENLYAGPRDLSRWFFLLAFFFLLLEILLLKRWKNAT